MSDEETDEEIINRLSKEGAAVIARKLTAAEELGPLTPADLHFLGVLADKAYPDLEIGTGAFPRGMWEARAGQLWRAGFVRGEPHHFSGRGTGFGGWSGILYEITEAGREALSKR